jgi:subtilisin family serine protease
MPHLPPFRIESTHSALTETIDWSLAAYHIPNHWKDTRGRAVRVAVLDTGIDLSHPDLADAIDDARDFTASRFGPADQNGHGTHTAGTIAARQNNLGVIGVAPDCRLLIGKVLGDDGSGSSANVAAGIDWAADSGADIISMSLGSPDPDDALLAAIERAVAKGKFIIAAAGNDGRDNSVNYPARWSGTIAVAAVDASGHLAPFSSRGPEVDIAAPGENILSTWLRGTYAKLSGTSMATPFVAGVTALLVALDRQSASTSVSAECGVRNAESRKYTSHSELRTPNSALESLRTIADLRDHLARTAIDAGPTGCDPGYGWGLINPDSLLEPEQTIPSPIAPTTPQPSPKPIPGGLWLWIPGAKTLNAEV